MANEKFQNACRRVPQPTPPIWFMRQAGRYHSHYQKLRQKYSFVDLCKIPELAAQVALGPVAEFDFDAAILFSDLLFPLEALGIGLTYTDSGPQLDQRLDGALLEELLPVPVAASQLEFQKAALQCTRQKLSKDKSLIGFVGGPWTLFVYSCEGTHSGSLVESKSKIKLFSRFCDILVPLLIQNITLQLEGGAEVVMIFDTASGELSPASFSKYIAPVLARLTRAFPGKLGYYSKQTMKDHFTLMNQSEWTGFGIDHRWDMSDSLAFFSSGFVQGNFDQAMLCADQTEFLCALDGYLAPLLKLSPADRAGWVCGLGHGMLPQAREKNVSLFIETIREKFR